MDKRVDSSKAKSDADKISATAMITLDAYSLARVPLAKEFAAAIRGAKPGEESWIAPMGINNVKPEQSVLLRARYLGSDALLRRLISSGAVKTVVERAAGMYPLGFSITRDLPVTYIETDISKDFAFKQELCAKMAKDLDVVPQGRHLFTNMDALTLVGVSSVIGMLEPIDWPICTIDAGLMIYQNEASFGEYIEAGRRLLLGGRKNLWIATDLCMRNTEFIERMISCGTEFKGYFDRIKETLGVDYRNFAPSYEKLVESLEQRGLEVKEYLPADLGYELRFDGIEKGTMTPEQLQSYLDYLSKNFRTLVLQLRK